MQFARLLIGLTTLMVLARAGDASACSCPSSGPPCQNAFQVDAVFAGTVRTSRHCQKTVHRFDRGKAESPGLSVSSSHPSTDFVGFEERPSAS